MNYNFSKLCCVEQEFCQNLLPDLFNINNKFIIKNCSNGWSGSIGVAGKNLKILTIPDLYLKIIELVRQIDSKTKKHWKGQKNKTKIMRIDTFKTFHLTDRLKGTN